jgi:hypothetical protein
MLTKTYIINVNPFAETMTACSYFYGSLIAVNCDLIDFYTPLYLYLYLQWNGFSKIEYSISIRLQYRIDHRVFLDKRQLTVGFDRSDHHNRNLRHLPAGHAVLMHLIGYILYDWHIVFRTISCINVSRNN